MLPSGAAAAAPPPPLPPGLHAHQPEPGGAVLVGGQLRPVEELKTAMLKGGRLRKYGRRGKPKDHVFRLSQDLRELQWTGSNAKPRCVRLRDVLRVQQGQRTAVFRRYPAPEWDALSLSVVYLEAGRERTLDLVFRSAAEFEVWFCGLQLYSEWAAGLAPHAPPGAAPGAAEAPPLANADKRFAAAEQALEKILGTAAAGPRAAQGAKAAPAASPGPKLALQQSPAVVPGRVSGVLGFPTRREIGDCYVWGAWRGRGGAAPPDAPRGAAEAGCSPQPVLLQSTHALDVVQVAAGSSGEGEQHAAFLTRGGEVYTWGCGAGGRLGHGDARRAAAPQQVQRLFGRGAAAVACGATYTAAALRDGGLYTWGQGLGGQLGLGPAVITQAWPARVPLCGVNGSPVKVDSVSCGPYHMAAVSRAGVLYTWGDGSFGQLGHGGRAACASPRAVDALRGSWVLAAACGWWHTAAVAVPREELGARRRGAARFSGDATPEAACSRCAAPGAAAAPGGCACEGGAAALPRAGAGGPAEREREREAERERQRSFDRALERARHAAQQQQQRGSTGGAPVSPPVGGRAAAWPPGPDIGGGGGDWRLGRASSDSLLRTSSGGGGGAAWLSGGAAAHSSFITAAGGGGHSSGGAAGGGVGGTLYTWGGACTWDLRGARDHHQGCLGHGDLAGRLVPTQVLGEDDIRQVACGRNFTVALNGIGQVLQMGATGATNPREHQAMWEGARMPVIVGGPLAGLCAELVAAGESHVLALGTLRGRPGAGGARGAAPAASAHRLVAWGCNQHGQLGCAGADDYAHPQFVVGINGRRVLQLAAGATFSMAVCEHDPGAAEGRWSSDGEGDFLRTGTPHSAASAPAARAPATPGPARAPLPSVAGRPLSTPPHLLLPHPLAPAAAAGVGGMLLRSGSGASLGAAGGGGGSAQQQTPPCGRAAGPSPPPRGSDRGSAAGSAAGGSRSATSSAGGALARPSAERGARGSERGGLAGLLSSWGAAAAGGGGGGSASGAAAALGRSSSRGSSVGDADGGGSGGVLPAPAATPPTVVSLGQLGPLPRGGRPPPQLRGLPGHSGCGGARGGSPGPSGGGAADASTASADAGGEAGPRATYRKLALAAPGSESELAGARGGGSTAAAANAAAAPQRAASAPAGGAATAVAAPGGLPPLPRQRPANQHGAPPRPQPQGCQPGRPPAREAPAGSCGGARRAPGGPSAQPGAAAVAMPATPASPRVGQGADAGFWRARAAHLEQELAASRLELAQLKRRTAAGASKPPGPLGGAAACAGAGAGAAPPVVGRPALRARGCDAPAGPLCGAAAAAAAPGPLGTAAVSAAGAGGAPGGPLQPCGAASAGVPAPPAAAAGVCSPRQQPGTPEAGEDERFASCAGSWASEADGAGSRGVSPLPSSPLPVPPLPAPTLPERTHAAAGGAAAGGRAGPVSPGGWC